MDDVQRLRRDRWRFRVHAATLLIGGVGLLVTLLLHAAMEAWLVAWLRVACSVMFVISGALAISIGRTMMSSAVGDDPFAAPDPYEPPGDALDSPGLWTLDLLPGASRAVAPYAIFVTGLFMLALTLYFAL